MTNKTTLHQYLTEILGDAFLQTMYMIIVPTIIATILGFILAIILVLTKPKGLKPNKYVYSVVGFVVNIVRSFPFIILLVALIPFTRFLIGTSIGETAAIVPITIGAAPFIARIIENALNEVDEGLIEAAKSFGATKTQIIFKVETNGSGGVKNALTKEEIEHAKCIIVAADKKVEMNRFDGKKVIITKVADGIHKADELLDRAVKGDAPIYHADSTANDSEESTNEEESLGRKFYKDLMNGVSHMLPFVVGGGILIAIAFLLDDYSINPANFGKNTPMAAFFKTVGEQAFGFMLPILAGYIAMSIADRPGLAVGFVGGVIAKDGYTFNNVMDFANSNPVSSGFLGALLAGFVAGYLVLLLKKIFSKLPASLEGIKPVLLYPVFGILLMAIFMMAVNPIMGAINTGLNNFLSSMSGSSQILLGAILAAMMAVDMGGPFNKAAYVFGTAQLTVANAGPEQFAIMAAVMIGGMVPPLAIALATTLFKDKFTESERKSGIVNYVMGLSFITEGAIPFAAGDPARVIPSCVVGSAIAGALSMAFSCGSRAPHGGIFILPVISNPLMYFVALVIGSVVGGLILGLLKKKKVS